VHGEGHLERVPTSGYTVKRVRLHPSKSWTIERLDNGAPVAETVFEGLDLVSALFFDPATGALMRSAAGIRSETVWVLSPSTMVIEGVGREGDRVPVHVVEVLPAPTSTWTGYELRAIEVKDLRALVLTADEGRAEQRVLVRSPGARPALAGDLVANVVTTSGLPVYSAAPRLDLPPIAAGSVPWRVRMAIDDTVVDLGPDNVETLVNGAPLPVPDGCREVVLVARGPLGADLRTSFAVASGLTATVPSRLLFPGDSAVVHLSSSSSSLNGGEFGGTVDVVVHGSSDAVEVSVSDATGGVLHLIARVSRVLWSILRNQDVRADFGIGEARLASDQLCGDDPPRVAVRIGTIDQLLQLTLEADGQVVQQSARTRAGGADGRWVFDLSDFSTTVSAIDSPRLRMVLWVGDRPVTVATIRPDFDVAQLVASSSVGGEAVRVDVGFSSRRMKHRVVRLWSLDRPWMHTLTEPVPSDSEGGVTFYGDPATIPCGRYLVEVAIDDGWSQVTRPHLGDRNTVRVDVGSPAELSNRLVRDDDPFSVLETALLRGFYPRRLDERELERVAPAATEALLLMEGGRLPAGVDTRQFEAVSNLALADPGLFTGALLELVEGGRADPLDLLRLGVALAHLLSAPPSLPHSAARQLWQIAPAIASAFDLSERRDVDRSERIREFTGWDPDDPAAGIPVGTAVQQVFLGMDAHQLDALERAVGLLPRDLLSIDSYAAATFEWLVADKASPRTAEHWWSRHRSIARGADEKYAFAAAHLEARVPPAGTERWAVLPEVTLAAALELVTGGMDTVIARRALMQAIEFAPRLVARDLVLARALLIERSSGAPELVP
jgi:hypothetical protein